MTETCFVPVFTVVTFPEASTVAMAVLLLDQVMVPEAPAGDRVAVSLVFSLGFRVMSVLFSLMDWTEADTGG